MFIGVSSRLKCGFFFLSDFSRMIFYFSGTGNSRWVAVRLAEGLDDSLVSLTDTLHRPGVVALRRDEAVGFVFPVYSWGPPPLVLELMRRVSFSSDPAYLYFVCTCGDDTGKTADVFSAAAAGRGWRCEAGYSVIMPNTYVCLPGFDVDAQEVAHRKRQAAIDRVGEIVARIREQRKGFDCHEGAFPWWKTYVIRPFFHRFLMSPKRFRVTEACIGCGLCERECPLHNISLTDCRPHWGADCAMCLSCYHHCPQHAVRYGSSTDGKGQYICR